MKPTPKILSAIALLGLSLSITSVHAFGSCKYQGKIDRVVDINDASLIELEAGAGSLNVKGENRKDVRIQAVLCSSNEEALSEMDVTMVQAKDKVHFETQFPRRSGWRDNESMSIDLVLSVPQTANLDVKDSSGEAQVSGVASLDMTDSSGRLQIKDIAGPLKVVDSSGELEAKNIKGNVTVTDSSGGILIKNVSGGLIIEADSSGGIQAKNIAKDVLVKIDSSGAINVQDVGGDFTVEKDTSGGITHKSVVGKVSIPPR